MTALDRAIAYAKANHIGLLGIIEFNYSGKGVPELKGPGPAIVYDDSSPYRDKSLMHKEGFSVGTAESIEHAFDSWPSQCASRKVLWMPDQGTVKHWEALL